MVTKEQIDERVEEARRWVASGDELAMTNSDRVIAALADKSDRLAPLNTEMLALVSDQEAGAACWSWNDGMKNTEDCDGQYNEAGEVTAEVCWEHRRHAFMTRIKEGT